MRILKISLLIFLCFIMLLLVLNVVPRKWAAPNWECELVEFYVLNYGHHTAFVLPAHSIPVTMVETLGLSGFTYVEFAWGDRGYFPADDIEVGKALRAIFTPTRSVMFVVGYNASPVAMFGEERVKRTAACMAEYNNLLEFIRNEFKYDETGEPILHVRGQRPNSTFYLAHRTYWGMYNSNNWVAQGLRRANLNSPVWGGLAFGLMWNVNEVE